jgi:hypothetical protein
MIDKKFAGKMLDVGSKRHYFLIEPHFDVDGYKPEERKTKMEQLRFSDELFNPGIPFTIPDGVAEALIESGNVEETEEMRKIATERRNE